MPNVSRLTASCLAVVVALMVPAALSQTDQAGEQTAVAERVHHFAVLSTGSSHGSTRHGKWYWGSNQRIYSMLRDVYGYPDDAIFRLHEEGRQKDPAVDGRASLRNMRKVFAHLAQIMKPEDRLFVYIVGHAGPRRGDYVHDLTDGYLTASEFGKWLNALPSQHVVIVLNPCHSGGFHSGTQRPGPGHRHLDHRSRGQQCRLGRLYDQSPRKSGGHRR